MQNTPYAVNDKLVISGQYFELYNYEIPYYVGYPKLKVQKTYNKTQVSQKSQEEMRDDNVRRTRIKIRRLINCNQDLTKFMTLTFNTNIIHLDLANPLFRSFIKRVQRRYPDFKYLCVPEFMKNGRVHYHLLCNLPFIDNFDLASLWGNGFVFIRKINHIDNVGAYVCKYLGKANFDVRYFKKNKFFYSYNLLRPIIVDKFSEIFDFLSTLPLSNELLCQKVKQFECFTKMLGMLKYIQYKVASTIKLAPI